jgi:hypothetical protein
VQVAPDGVRIMSDGEIAEQREAFAAMCQPAP